MKLYAAKLSIGRADIGPFRAHTFPRADLTAPEIAVLRHIHGDDCLTDIKPREEIKRTQAEELARLEGKYTAKPLLAVFGPLASARLPTHISTDEMVVAD